MANKFLAETLFKNLRTLKRPAMENKAMCRNRAADKAMYLEDTNAVLAAEECNLSGEGKKVSAETRSSGHAGDNEKAGPRGP